MQEILVSVICNAYNHEKYIRDALESFVMQKTNFAFEVLVHDDASTDKTADIIREYEEKYPNIIKPIYQTENQYSKKINNTRTHQLPRAKGKYIAFCEGDDCWIDENKLQMQVDYMEANPECSFCFTNAEVRLLSKNKTKEFISYFNKEKYTEQCDFNVEELNRFVFIPTCSFLYPKKNYDLFPETFNAYCFGGDRKVSLFSTALGYAHYIPALTCRYNYGVANSAMTRKKTVAERLKIANGYINLAKNIDSFTNYKYKEAFEKYILEWEMDKICVDYKNLIKDPYYKNIYKMMPIKLKIKAFLKTYCPFIVKVLKRIRG